MDGQKGQRMTRDKNDSHILQDTGLVINRSRVRIPAAALPTAILGKFVLLSPSSIVWYRPMSGDAGEVTGV